MDKVKLKELRSLTEASLVECMNALTASDGDVYKAAARILTDEDISLRKNEILSRIIVPTSSKGAPGSEELKILERITIEKAILDKDLKEGF